LDTPFYYLLGQVDLSCCAVHYSHQYGLKESVKGAIIQCQNHLFEIMKNNEMSSEPRIIKREQKLVQRGWKNLRNKYAFYNDEQNFENIKKRYMRSSYFILLEIYIFVLLKCMISFFICFFDIAPFS